MLVIQCPFCGERPEIEFVYGGQAHLVRTQASGEPTEADWINFLYMRDNIKGLHAERWRHIYGCARFFNALRDTTTDHFVATYQIGERPPAIAREGKQVK